MKFNIGDIVELYFWDHATHDDGVQCAAIGRVVRQNPRFITLEHWSILDSSEIWNGNEERVTILRSSVFQWALLRPVSQGKIKSWTRWAKLLKKEK